MKTLVWWIAAMAVAVLALAGPLVLPVQADAERWWIQAVDELGNAITSGVTVHVFTANSATTATVYTSATLDTAATNPGTADGKGVFEWYANSATTANFDVLVMSNRGWARHEALTPASGHRVVVSQHASRKRLRIGPLTTPGTVAETSSGRVLPRNAVVEDVYIEVTANTGGATTIAVGLLSSESGGVLPGASGLCNLIVPTNMMGTFRCQPQPASTTSFTTGDFTNALYYNGRGTLLSVFTAGAPGTGFYQEKPYVDASKRTHTVSYSNGTFTGTAYVVVTYQELGNR